MLTDTAIKNLVYFFKETPAAIIYDQEEETFTDQYGNEDHFEYLAKARIKFNVPNKNLKELKNLAEEELTHNRLITAFNKEFYCNEAILDFNVLLKKFTTITIAGLDIKIRTDFFLKYQSPDEDETVEEVLFDINVMDKPYKQLVVRPKMQIITLHEIKNIPPQTLKKISEYFQYQENLIKNHVNYLVSVYPIQKRKKNGTSYEHEYFQFNFESFNNSNDAKENINDFFTALINKGYVESGSLDRLINFFNDRPSLKKVKWLKDDQELFYLIKRLKEKKIIVDTKRFKIYIIPKVFIKADGTEFSPSKIQHLHKTKKSSDIDDIISHLS